MVDRFIDYPESATNLASLFKNPNSENLETKAFEILKTMNPKELAIYMTDNPECDQGLELAMKYLRGQDEAFKTKFKIYLKEPYLLELDDEIESIFDK